MRRQKIKEREDWRSQAEALGFNFHSMYGAAYWCESACYEFTLKQIEDDIEDPSNELEQMCFEIVDQALKDEEILIKLSIPEDFWDYIQASWIKKEKNLYGRFDFSYNGTSPAKLLEYNADTPTALYESAVFQWIWLEQAIEAKIIPKGCDQFNSLHERLVEAFKNFDIGSKLHLTSSKGYDEDEATVRYLEECAIQAGLETNFIYLEDIGIDDAGALVDLDDDDIFALFKLYPWEWLVKDEFSTGVRNAEMKIIEPGWKMILSNKGLLPLLWENFEKHPNLLPAYFIQDSRVADITQNYVKKPLFSREGANVEIFTSEGLKDSVGGPYGEEGYIVQALEPLPVFESNHTVVGTWMVASQASGLCLREDDTPITKDTSRFVPHVILD